jgi:hypothetical protein
MCKQQGRNVNDKKVVRGQPSQKHQKCRNRANDRQKEVGEVRESINGFATAPKTILILFKTSGSDETFEQKKKNTEFDTTRYDGQVDSMTKAEKVCIKS